MATETQDTREQHVTARGDTMTIRQHVTWAEWVAQGASIPRIGDAYNLVTRPDLICSDIRARAKNDSNALATITSVFSTGIDYPIDDFHRAIPNRIASWEESLDISATTISGSDIKWSSKTGTFNPTGAPVYTEVSWATKWADKEAGRKPDDAPDLLIDDMVISYFLTVYGDNSYLGRFINANNHVNSVLFLSRIQDQIQYVKQKYTSDALTLPDVGKWKFQGAKHKHIGGGRFRYDLEFRFNRDGWNYQHGISGLGLYYTMDLTDLVVGMDRIEDPRTQGLHDL